MQLKFDWLGVFPKPVGYPASVQQSNAECMIGDYLNIEYEEATIAASEESDLALFVTNEQGETFDGGMYRSNKV